MAPPRKPTEDEIVNVFIDMDGEQRETLLTRLNDAHAITLRVEARLSQANMTLPPFETTDTNTQP